MSEKEKPIWKRDEFQLGLMAVAVVALAVLAFMEYQQLEQLKTLGVSGPTTAALIPGDSLYPATPSGPLLELFVMSQCPYGTMAEEEVFKALDVLGNSVQFKLRFITTPNSDGSFSSLHGQPELDENKRQACVQKHAPEKLVEYVSCINQDYQNAGNIWKSCANSVGLTPTIDSCISAGEADAILREDAAEASKHGIGGSPSYVLAGKSYTGGRSSLDIQRALCNAGSSASQCSALPACASDDDCVAVVPADQFAQCKNPNTQQAMCEGLAASKVSLVVLTSSKCTTCDDSQISSALSDILKNVEVKRVDVSTDEGKALLKETGAVYLPTFLLGKDVTNNLGWQSRLDLQAVFDLKGSWYKLDDDTAGSTYFASDDARSDFLLSTGINVSDGKPDLDFFVMSYCPYGNSAEEAIYEAYKNLKDHAEFKPRMVIYEQYQGGSSAYCVSNGKYCSMHGVQELNQDVRELCVYNKMGVEKFFEFAKAMNAKCTYKNADSCWEAVAKDLGLDTDSIKTCEANEKLAILEEQLYLNKAFGVSGSPTTFVDGEKINSARTAQGASDALCALLDPKPEACSKTYAAAAQVTGSC